MADSSDSDSEGYTTKDTGTTRICGYLQALEIDDEKNLEPLRPGDVIVYNHPVFVAVSKESIRVTQVLSTEPDVGMPLSLCNGEFLPVDTDVRRIQKYKYGAKEIYRVSIPSRVAQKDTGSAFREEKTEENPYVVAGCCHAGSRREDRRTMV